MLEKKICVAPAFVRQITRLAAEWLAQIACHPMPMAHILVERVTRGEVEAATKPPHRIALCRLSLDITHVHVRGRDRTRGVWGKCATAGLDRGGRGSRTNKQNSYEQ